MLLEKARAALTQLQQARDAQAGLSEAQELQRLNKALSGKAARVAGLIERVALLRQYQVPLSEGPAVGPVRQAIVNLSERFREVSTVRTLTQGNRWSKVVDGVETLSDELDSQLREDWREYFSNKLFAGPPPEKRKATLVQTPDNKQAITQYTRLYESFVRYRSSVPASAEALEEVHKNSRELETIKFKEDVPDNVKRFFDAVATGGGASLELLTHDVIDWLRENKLLGSYVARARL